MKKCVVPSTPGPIARRFTPAAGSVEEQAINAFFVCNFMHDFFSLVGFGEEDGNFQQQNFSGAGKSGDRLVVSIFTSAQGNANMRAQNDGGPAELSLGVWRNDMPPSIGRPVALDAGVVIHEYAHGVSQRLVSGRLKKTALSQPPGTRQHAFEAYVFAGGEARYVPFNATLDGGLFHDGQEAIGPKRFITDFRRGVSVRWHWARLTYSVVDRSAEFDVPAGAIETQRFGSFAFTIEP